MQNTTLLFIEDYATLSLLWGLKCKDMGVNYLIASTTEDAEKIFQDNKDQIDIIFMDACLHAEEINTIPLTKKIRNNFEFNKPIIAISGYPNFNHALTESGCNYSIDKIKVTKSLNLELINKIIKGTYVPELNPCF